jgi:hypothetical protein
VDHDAVADAEALGDSDSVVDVDWEAPMDHDAVADAEALGDS